MLPKSFDDVSINLRQLDLDTDDYRPLLKEIKKAGETRIVLDCDFEKVGNILKQAEEIGLVSEYYAYLITNQVGGSILSVKREIISLRKELKGEDQLATD